jgi:hypothetical protein
MFDDYEDDDLIADLIVAEDEIDRETLKGHLFDGTWKLHCVDASGLAWFAPTGQPAIPEPEDDLADYQGVIAGTIAAARPEPELEDVPVDIQATDWFRELKAGATVDVPDDLTFRFLDPSSGSVDITPGEIGDNV